MLKTEFAHHEAALSLLQQLLLTGTLLVPAGKVALHAVKTRINRRKQQGKGKV